MTTSAFAQTSISGGINAAESTNLGFWGINPSLEIQHKLNSSFYADFNINGFLDLSRGEQNHEFRRKTYHKSLLTDLGINYQVINNSMSWAIGIGGTYRIGNEQYVSSTSYRGSTLVDYKIDSHNLSGFGYYLRNTMGFGKHLQLNLTVYRFDFTGQFWSVGPSYEF